MADIEELENRTFDELEIGETATFDRTLTERDLALFAAVSGDRNPLHLDAEFAATTMFGERIAHGMFAGAAISAAIAMTIPGPGTIYAGQELSFRAPVKLGDTLTVTLTVTKKEKKGKHQTPFVTLTTLVTNQHGKKVVVGEALVVAPTEKQRIPLPPLPPITIG